MVKTLLGLFLLLTISNGQHTHQEGERIECEPIAVRRNPENLITKYKLEPDGPWTAATVKETFYDNYNITSKKDSKSASVHYRHLISIINTDRITQFRRGTNCAGRMYNFYSGDSVILHQLDPKTGEYRKSELGFHTNEFFVYIKPDVWFATEFHHDIPDKHIVWGFTRIFKNNQPGRFEWAERQELLEKFPDYKELVTRFTD